MKTTTIAPIAQETLRAAAQKVGPEAAVLLILLAIQDQDHRLVATLAEVTAQTRYTPDVVASILRGLDEASVIAIRPQPHAECLDTTHEIMVIHSPVGREHYQNTGNVKRLFIWVFRRIRG